MRKSGSILSCFVLLTVAVTASPSRTLYLDSPTDREAFRRWFTFLAESRFHASGAQPEIRDCAGLVRWAFREALKAHNTEWSRTLELPVLPALPSVNQFAYPRTPWGANLFRTSDFGTAEFADATTLRRFNTTLLSRDISRARPGDLLFYAQFGHRMAAHVMIYLGPGQIPPDRERWLVYHTGPSGTSGEGEIRKVRLSDLLAHPSPEWRPVTGNSNFLGVWRLNLIADNSL